MSARHDKRRHPRTLTRFDALYSSGRREGAGVLADISYSGARLEQSSLTPEIGTAVRIYIFVQPVSPFELAGRVVRHTIDGFAVECESPDSAVRHLVDDVAAILASPARP